MVHLFVILFLIWLFYISLIKIKTLNVNTIYLAFRLLIDFKMNQMNYIYSQNDIVTISIIKLSIDQF
jgi:hypothetical protein